MEMGTFVAGLLLVVVLFFFSGFWKDEGFLALFFFIIGVACLLVFSIQVAPSIFDSGEPMIDIGAGTHKVAFVYVAGDNISIGVERENGHTKEKNLFLYQFKKEVFEDPISVDAKELKVVEVGNFKKLQLR